MRGGGGSLGVKQRVLTRLLCRPQHRVLLKVTKKAYKGEGGEVTGTLGPSSSSLALDKLASLMHFKESILLVSKRVPYVLFCYVCSGLLFLRWLMIIT